MSSSALKFEGDFNQISISELTVDNMTIDTDGAILNIDSVKSLQISNLNFANIDSYNSDSSNNYMVSISSMDLSASITSLIQNFTVHNCMIGVLTIKALSGNFNDGNMLTIQDMIISNSTLSKSIDLIALTSLTTYESYSITFSNIVFENLELLQNSNLFNFAHILKLPVIIKDSAFQNITGGQITIGSFTTEITDLSTMLSFQNITAQNINAQFGSFIQLHTGAELSIENSSFSNIS